MPDRHLIVYATTEGHTLKVARFAADHLNKCGHLVELMSADTAEDLDLTPFDKVLLLGSVHIGRYQQTLANFASAHQEALTQKQAGFVSVSLAASGDDPEDWAGLERTVKAFSEGTGWVPAQVEHVAGAFRFAKYDYFKSLAMRFIARTKGVNVDPHSDTEFTDWKAFEAFLDGWQSSKVRGAA